MPKKVKIPKKIAGVKLPKKARKTANKAIEMGASPVVREIAAAAIGAVGAKAAAAKAPKLERLRAHGGGHAQIELGAIGEVLRDAAIDGLRRFFEGFDEGMRNLAAREGNHDEDDEEEEERPAPRAAKASRPGAARG